VILYDFRCTQGHTFEAGLSSMFAEDPDCQICGSRTNRKPAGVGLSGQADPGPSRAERPRSWRQVNGGNPSTVRAWQRAIEKRERLEDKYPELAGDSRPVLAHEGLFSKHPLRAGDDIASAVASASAPADPGADHVV
jgi:hypothetical protein